LSSNFKLVEVYRASGELEALAIKGMLESFGIPSMLRSNAAGSIHPFSVNGMGLVSVLVKEENFEDAAQLINDRNEDV